MLRAEPLAIARRAWSRQELPEVSANGHVDTLALQQLADRQLSGPNSASTAEAKAGATFANASRS